ncbi:MAG: TCR/Tet family MFS transporter [Phenylobacterium sp.]|uniref:TCR/Tet family MFS transporter n=1 Tax=Phenylobacterium sp. TaxID=1871053 RepID=UPI0030178F32
MTTEASIPTQRRAAFGFIFASALLNAVSFGITIPILPGLIKEFAGGDTATAAEWNMLFGSVWGVMQFFFGPILGALSDRIGRRPVLLISFLGLAFDFLFLVFAPSLMWLFVARIVNGMTAASFSTANAYVADVTPVDQRARYFGFMGASFGFGFLIGPVLGGLLAGPYMQSLVGDFAIRLPFAVAGILALLNFLYGLFVLPESLPPERRSARFDWRRANPVGSLKFLFEHGKLAGLATVGFLFQIAHNVLPAVFVLYTGYRYNWDIQTISLTMFLTGALGIFMQTLVVGPVVRNLGERGALLIGCAGAALGFLCYGLAPTGLTYLMAAPIFALSNLLSPGLQGLMTRRVGPEAQGRLQGANQSLAGIATIIGPFLFGGSFAYALKHESLSAWPGLPILIASSLMVAAFFVAWRVGRPLPVAPLTEPATVAGE